MSAPDAVVDVPAPAPAELFRPKGQPEGIDALAGIVLEAAGRYDEYSDESAEFRQRKGWTGESGDRYTRRAKVVAVRAGRMRNTLKRTGRVLLACADRLRNHKRTYQEHVDRKKHIDDELHQLHADIRAAKSVTAEQLTALQARANELARKYRALVEDDERLARLVDSNEQLMADTMASATDRDDVLAGDGGRPESAQNAMRKPGSPIREESTPAQVAAWWKSLSAEEKRAVTASYAHTIAGAEGLPPEVRERADRVRDEEVTTRLQAKLADGTIEAEEQQRLDRLLREAEREAKARK